MMRIKNLKFMYDRSKCGSEFKVKERKGGISETNDLFNAGVKRGPSQTQLKKNKQRKFRVQYI